MITGIINNDVYNSKYSSNKKCHLQNKEMFITSNLVPALLRETENKISTSYTSG